MAGRPATPTAQQAAQPEASTRRSRAWDSPFLEGTRMASAMRSLTREDRVSEDGVRLNNLISSTLAAARRSGLDAGEFSSLVKDMEGRILTSGGVPGREACQEFLAMLRRTWPPANRREGEETDAREVGK